MIVTFSSDAGPIEGFIEATFRTGVNDEGIGELRAPQDVIDAIDGPISCFVDGLLVFRWTPEDRELEARDDEIIQISGRGDARVLERTIVLPVGYPTFTDRSRTEQGAPFAIWADLLAEAQGRGRAIGLTPSWTATEDSKGDPWTETIDVSLDPGTNLRDLLDSMAEVEGAEWIIRPDGTIDAAPQLGDDRSGEVVLFYGADQVSRNRRSSSREQRQAIFVEASTGVSEALNSADPEAGEIWLEAQDYADPLSRQALADKLALKLGAPEEEADIELSPDAGAFSRFFPGDLVNLDAGSGAPEVVRVVGITLGVRDGVGVSLEATLITEVELRSRRIERAIQARADVQLAAAPAIQRRHGLVTADKILTGELQVETIIQSQNYIPGSSGWKIDGDGSVEFGDAIFRGDLESDNYDPGVDGWRLDRDGNAEFNEGIFRGGLIGGSIDIGNGTFTVSSAGAMTATSGNIGGGLVGPGVDAANLTTGFLSADRIATGLITGPKLADGSVGTVKIANAAITNAKIENGTITGAKISGGTITAANIQNGTITGAKISGGTITAAQIANGTITGTQIAGSTITGGNIAGSTITGANISGGTITGANIADATISGAKISSATITSGNIGNAQITTAKIANLAVTNAKIDDLNVNKLTGTTISGFSGNFLTFEALSVTATLSNMAAPGFNVAGSNSFYGSSARVASTIRYDGAPGSTDFNLPVISRRTSDNILVIFTSSRRYKKEIEDVAPPEQLLDLRLRSYLPIDDSHDRTIGLIAEEVHDLGMTSLVKYDPDGQPRSVSYDLIGAMAIPIIRDLRDRIAALEEKIDA